MKTILFFVVLLISSEVHSQTPYIIWGRGSSQPTIQGLGAGLSVATFGSNAVYISGYYQDSISFPGNLLNGSCGVFLAKYDSSGNLQWVRGGRNVYYQVGSPYGYSIATDTSGNIYFTGHINTQ